MKLSLKTSYSLLMFLIPAFFFGIIVPISKLAIFGMCSCIILAGLGLASLLKHFVK